MPQTRRQQHLLLWCVVGASLLSSATGQAASVARDDGLPMPR